MESPHRRQLRRPLLSVRRAWCGTRLLWVAEPERTAAGESRDGGRRRNSQRVRSRVPGAGGGTHRCAGGAEVGVRCGALPYVERSIEMWSDIERILGSSSPTRDGLRGAASTVAGCPLTSGLLLSVY